VPHSSPALQLHHLFSIAKQSPPSPPCLPLLLAILLARPNPSSTPPPRALPHGSPVSRDFFSTGGVHGAHHCRLANGQEQPRVDNRSIESGVPRRRAKSPTRPKDRDRPSATVALPHTAPRAVASLPPTLSQAMHPIAPFLHCSPTAQTGGFTFRDELLAMRRGLLRTFQLKLHPYPLQRQSSETARYPQTGPSSTMNGDRATNVFQETAAKRSHLGNRFGADSKTALSGNVKSVSGIVLQTVPTRTRCPFTVSTTFTMSQ